MCTVMSFKIEFNLTRQLGVQIKVRNPRVHSCKTPLLSLAFLLSSAGKERTKVTDPWGRGKKVSVRNEIAEESMAGKGVRGVKRTLDLERHPEVS